MVWFAPDKQFRNSVQFNNNNNNNNNSCWTWKLGHVDILHAVSLMGAYMAQPHQQHLEMLYGMFGYLKEHPECTMVMDPCEPFIDDTWFKMEGDWDFLSRGSTYPLLSRSLMRDG